MSSSVINQAFSQEVTMVRGKKAVVTNTDLELEDGEEYTLKNSSGKKVEIEVLKVKKNKAMVKIVKGVIKEGEKVTVIDEDDEESDDDDSADTEESDDDEEDLEKRGVVGLTLNNLSLGDSDQTAGSSSLNLSHDSTVGAEVFLDYRPGEHWGFGVSLSYYVMESHYTELDGATIVYDDTVDTKQTLLDLMGKYYFTKNISLFVGFSSATMELEFKQPLVVNSVSYPGVVATYSGLGFLIGVDGKYHFSEQWALMGKLKYYSLSYDTLEIESSYVNATGDIQDELEATALTLGLGIAYIF